MAASGTALLVLRAGHAAAADDDNDDYDADDVDGGTEAGQTVCSTVCECVAGSGTLFAGQAGVTVDHAGTDSPAG